MHILIIFQPKKKTKCSTSENGWLPNSILSKTVKWLGVHLGSKSSAVYNIENSLFKEFFHNWQNIKKTCQERPFLIVWHNIPFKKDYTEYTNCIPLQKSSEWKCGLVKKAFLSLITSMTILILFVWFVIRRVAEENNSYEV